MCVCVCVWGGDSKYQLDKLSRTEYFFYVYSTQLSITYLLYTSHDHLYGRWIFQCNKYETIHCLKISKIFIYGCAVYKGHFAD